MPATCAPRREADAPGYSPEFLRHERVQQLVAAEAAPSSATGTPSISRSASGRISPRGSGGRPRSPGRPARSRRRRSPAPTPVSSGARLGGRSSCISIRAVETYSIPRSRWFDRCDERARAFSNHGLARSARCGPYFVGVRSGGRPFQSRPWINWWSGAFGLLAVLNPSAVSGHWVCRTEPLTRGRALL